MNIMFFITGSAAFVAVALFLWMKWRMKVSKGRFAITVVSSLITCFAFGLAAMSTSFPIAITSKITEKLGLGPIETNAPVYLIALLTFITTCFVYKFGVNAIKCWEVPPRVSEIDLAEKHLENNMFFLSFEKFKILFKGQKDKIASDAVANWKAKVAEAPNTIERKDLLRDMLVSSIREIRIDETGWRDDGKLWVGEMYGLTNAQTKPILALIFDSLPTAEDIKDRVKALEGKIESLKNFQFFALYLSSGKDLLKSKDLLVDVDDYKVRVLSSRQMILMGLDLVNYAKELISNFENTRVGGTTATLRNSYVDLYVQTPQDSLNVKPINKAIENWLKEDNNCHLAITGEYGQGKSTALMKFCIDWAERFLETGYIGERVPLLIELRGQSPSETDPLGFISSWCARYSLLPQQVLNLIKSGDAILIFEGFDELRNAGKSYFRHQHFNALWKFAYPKTKLIFTGRPNFFLDKEETNRTLRNQMNRTTGGDNYSEVWKLQKLDEEQIKEACRSYDPNIRQGIISSIENSKDFLDIVCRPSMLPVVATIWPEIEKLQESGHPLTGAELIERYIQAVFSRKEAELEQDRIKLNAPTGSRYLLLPKQLRELLTVCVAWRMSGLKYKNTIPRSEVTDMVREIYDVLISIGKSEGVSDDIAEGIIDFERRHVDENFADKVEAITTEICSAGLLIPDTAGGATNLRFPHKQFFEFLIAKAIKITTELEGSGASQIIQKSSSDSRIIQRLINEPNAIIYLSECIGQNISGIYTKPQMLMMKINAIINLVISRIDILLSYFTYKLFLFRKPEKKYSLVKRLVLIERYDNTLDVDLAKIIHYHLSKTTSMKILSATLMALIVSTYAMYSLFSKNKDLLISFDIINSLVLILSTTLMFFMYSISYNKDNNNFVLTQFLKIHWNNAEQIPKNNITALKCTLRTLFKGGVYFPVKQISEPSDFEQFLYPAKYFGDS